MIQKLSRKPLIKVNQVDKFKTFIEDRSENVKVGLVGAGQMGQGIVAQISKMYGVDIVCIIDRNQKQLEIASDRYKKYKNNQILCSCLLYTSPSPRDVP